MSKSMMWGFTLTWAMLTLYLTTIPNFSPAKDTMFSWILSNGGHFSFFGVQAALLYTSLKPSKSRVGYAIVSTSLYGFLIELIQRRVPGRSFDLLDWGLDTLGALVFIYFMRKYPK